LCKKINLLELLDEENISNKKFNDISYLMNALLDEEAITGISNLEDRELLIERYLEKAKTLSSTEDDYLAVMTLKEYDEAFHKIEAPQGMPWYDEPQFFESEINKLRKHLSKEALKQVLSRDRHF